MRAQKQMKLNKRAFRLLVEVGYSPEQNPAIAALVQFASQNSGLDPRNYASDWRDRAGIAALRSEQRAISADYARFREALASAKAEGVADADIIAEAPNAFSGRLEWKTQKAITSRMTDPAKFGGSQKGGIVKSEIEVGDWSYCTGQYFPTEYRKAAATLLESAIRRVRGNRPKAKGMPRTMAELKALNEANGGCWFGKSEMRFFGTKIESGIIGPCYFLTSEQPPHGARKFSVRSFDAEGGIDTIGEFCTYRSRSEAMTALRAHIGGQPVTS